MSLFNFDLDKDVERLPCIQEEEGKETVAKMKELRERTGSRAFLEQAEALMSMAESPEERFELACEVTQAWREAIHGSQFSILPTVPDGMYV